MFYSLPVLMYHSISRFKHRLCVSPEMFDDQCRVLAKAGWRGISLTEAEEYFCRQRRLPRKTALLTFDDGYLDNYANAEPILRAHGHQGVIFPVAGLINTRDVLHPTSEDIFSPDFSNPLPDLDSRKLALRWYSGYRVTPILFCSWKELARMRQRGAMDMAPHSMHHGRVITSLHFKKLYSPEDWYSFFDVAPHKAVWGMPRFPLKHGLTHRAYHLVPELFELVRTMVPQTAKEAREFLARKKNRRAVTAAIRKLPRVAIKENERQYRSRLAREFTTCRTVFAERLGVTPVSFCWPWGDYNDIALEEARKAGFHIFFTTRRGMNLYGNANAVRRIGVHEISGKELLAKIGSPSFLLRELSCEIYHWGKELKARFFSASRTRAQRPHAQ